MTARLLVVDDEPQIRRVLRAALAAAGHIVVEAKTGEEALAQLAGERPDVILLDMNMPGMGGLAACRELRQATEAAIIMLTVRDSEADKVAALDAGADDYLTKPFGMPELLARIRAHLRRLPSTGSSTTLDLSGGFRLDLATRVVRLADREVRLTPKEFQLLHYLATHANTVVPHARLLQAVWGPDYGRETEYLHVFMNQLRKKIEPDPAHPRYLVTEPWQGYRLVTEPSASRNP